jgi:MOSC domain-containing protein YiiM
MTGTIIAISTSTRKGVPKSNVPQIRLIEGFGLEGDIHGGDWHRQVSLLALERIDEMRAKGLPELQPGAFAENITTKFLELPSLPIGTRLKLGSDAVLEVTQIGKECHSRCSIYATVGDCVMPREGIFARVIHGGTIIPGDEIVIMIPVSISE